MKNLLPCLLMLAAAGAPIAPQMAAAAGTNAVSTVAAGDAKLNQLFGDPVIAKGKGIEIKQSELDAEVSRTKTVLASRGGTVPPGIEPQVLDGLIGLKLLIAKATPEDRAKATEQFEKSFASYKKAQDLTDAEFKERLAPELKIEGRTMDEWRKQQIDQATIPIVLERELKIRITPDEAKKFYEDNPSKFETAEMVRVSHILLSTKDPDDKNPDPSQRKDLPDDQKKAKFKEMQDLLKRARAGEDFTKLAKQYSEDPGVKENNGEYKFSREDPFVPEFKTTAFALKTNEVSDIITTMFGYHILKLWEKIPAKKEAFAGVDTKTIYHTPQGEPVTIEKMLSDEETRKQLPAYIKTLKQEANVQILDDKLKVALDTSSSEPAK